MEGEGSWSLPRSRIGMARIPEKRRQASQLQAGSQDQSISEFRRLLASARTRRGEVICSGRRSAGSELHQDLEKERKVVRFTPKLPA